MRVRAANGDLARHEEWLLIEWPHGEAEPRHCWLSTLPDTSPSERRSSMPWRRWLIERDYEELKSELCLSHYEGRNWRGFHHHATPCIAAYGFVMLERLRGKETPLDSRRLKYLKASGRAGLFPMQRHNPISIAALRFALARAIARTLLQCQCCGNAWRIPT